MILSSLSNVTTSATQLGAQEWLMYLVSGQSQERQMSELRPLTTFFLIPLSPGRASGQRCINHMLIVYSEHVDTPILKRQGTDEWARASAKWQR